MTRLRRPPRRYDYVADGPAIYVESFATIRREADAAPAARRRREARGPDDPRQRAGRPGAPTSSSTRGWCAPRATALTPGRRSCATPGWSRWASPPAGCPADNEVLCFLNDERVPGAGAEAWGTTRTAAAVSLWEPHLDGAVVAIGNAPTALFHLLEMLLDGAPAAGRDRRLPGRVHRRRRVEAGARRRSPPTTGSTSRSSPSAAAAAARRWPRRPSTRWPRRRNDATPAASTASALGPGDPELITLKAARLIGAADVVAFHAGVGKQSNARRIAADLIPAGVIEEELRYPVTTGATDHPGRLRRRAGRVLRGVRRAARRAPRRRAATSCCSPRATRCSTARSCTCTTGWPSGSRPRWCPGVPAFAAATAAVASPLVRQTDVLTVLPGHPARARARPPAGRHRRRDHHEARPDLPRRALGARAGRPAGARGVRRARLDARASAGCPSPTSTPTRCRTSR